MAKYIRTYSNNSEYEAAKASADFMTPNVGYIEDTKEVKYVNDISDLYKYCVVGTLDNSGTRNPYVKINEYQFNSATMRWNIKDDGSFVFEWFGSEPITGLSFYNNSISSRNFLTIDKIKLPTESCTKISFGGNKKLEKIDLSGVNTSSVTNMQEMFAYNDSLTSLNIRDLDTSNVTNMSTMFIQSTGLTSLDLDGFIRSNVTLVSYMFKNCFSLTTVNLSNCDLSGTNVIYEMFYNCRSLTTVTMDNTNQTTFDKIKQQLASYSVASHVTIIRDGVNWKYQNGAWVEV